MKRFLILLITCLLFSGCNIRNLLTGGTSVTIDDAKTVALNFFKLASPTAPVNLAMKLILTKSEANGAADFYVFAASPVKGFVIVSADEAIEPVIAYSTEANFDVNPAALKQLGIGDWMAKSAKNISGAVSHHAKPDANISNRWSAYRHGHHPDVDKPLTTPVAQLLTTTWNQSPYYNADCPGGSVTGCVATAMAQIMKFWNWPSNGTGSFSYNDNSPVNYGTLSANFGNTTYNWGNMPNSLFAANSDIATLMFQCGVSVAMAYSPSESSAYVLQAQAGGHVCAQSAYSTYFNYNASTITGILYSNYTESVWIATIETELNERRPVQYVGWDNGGNGGHTWVCDGYNSSNQLHMNWGWGGAYNGYFSVTNLNAGGYTFGKNDAALIGIKPNLSVSITPKVIAEIICNRPVMVTPVVVGQGNFSYLWSTNETTAGIYVHSVAHVTTTYTVTVTDKNSSTASASVSTICIDRHRRPRPKE